MRRLAAFPFLIATVAACSPVAEIGSRALVVQGKYEWMTCEQSAHPLTTYRDQERQLLQAINASAQEASGYLVNATVHWPTLTEVRGHIRELEQARAQKKCEPPK